ncbi:Leucine zipper protein 1 [Frankliniella fusca]|uniref:Leucine zipper protein 1 n=1 Tax=Frankliniella fusca TaxID=407009 RepID=A0AAE1H0N7_9NEOP|nr:Leucine zipper protein 1 [Frankliniella fusca]
MFHPISPTHTHALVFGSVEGAYPVQITHLHVPQYVSNGSHAAILDCEYALGPRESINASGLVVKWFFNDGPAPVYQWIPPQRPQELGLLRGRLDLGYQATKSNASRHRALYIRNPTTDLSGEWKCLVSTFDDEDFMTKKMVVYAPITGHPEGRPRSVMLP